MQEAQTVTFQPICEGYLPWFAKLFALYLFIMIVALVVQFVSFVWNLRKLRKLQRNYGSDSSSFKSLWTDCTAKAYSLKELATLTFLLSFLDLSWCTADILCTVRTAKSPNSSYILLAIADALAPFSLGIIVCIALYLFAMFTAFVLKRRRPTLSTGSVPFRPGETDDPLQSSRGPA
jgi:hypothetical protein